MNFELTPQQQTLQKAAIEFARRGLNSNMIERDAQQVFSHDGWKKCAAFGVQGMPIPKEYGGREAGPITTIAVMEGLGYGGLDQGLLFSINAHMWTNSIPLLNAGSDIFSMQTRAAKDGSNYILSGRKVFVTNAPVADSFVIYGTGRSAARRRRHPWVHP